MATRGGLVDGVTITVPEVTSDQDIEYRYPIAIPEAVQWRLFSATEHRLFCDSFLAASVLLVDSEALEAAERLYKKSIN